MLRGRAYGEFKLERRGFQRAIYGHHPVRFVTILRRAKLVASYDEAIILGGLWLYLHPLRVARRRAAAAAALVRGLAEDGERAREQVELRVACVEGGGPYTFFTGFPL